MLEPRKALTGIDLYTYRHRCRDLGFAWLGGSAQRFVDLRYPKAGYLAPVTDSKGRVLRQETIDALIRWRQGIIDEQNELVALAEQRARLVDRLAPPCLPPPRATLAGDEAIRVLAEDLRNTKAREGNVTYRELQLLGWPRATLFKLEPLARETADALEGGI